MHAHAHACTHHSHHIIVEDSASCGKPRAATSSRTVPSSAAARSFKSRGNTTLVHRLAKPIRKDLPWGARGRFSRSPHDVAGDGDALRALERGVYTQTSKQSHAARVLWWTARAAVRGLTAFPLTTEGLQLAGALLKQGRYRSARQYLYTLKKENVLRGGQWTELLDATFRDTARSCERGLGAARQADALPISQLRFRGDYQGGKLQLASPALLTGCWWLLREIELANLRLQDVSVAIGRGCGVAALKVSASKTDWKAKGLVRRHGCACPSVLCPVRAVRALLEAAPAGADGNTPLVRGRKGGVARKAEVVKEIRKFAVHLGAPPGNYSGHSLRVTGAQRLALSGVSEDKIRVFGRWASAAMLRYVRDKLLEHSGLEVSTIVESTDKGGDIGTVLREPAHSTPASASSSSSSTRLHTTIVTSKEGVAHLWENDLHTFCGWMWKGKGAVVSSGVSSCKKCTGTSVRWAGGVSRPTRPNS